MRGNGVLSLARGHCRFRARERACALERERDGRDVDVDDVVDVLRVAAGHRDRDRDSERAEPVEHHPVAVGESGLREPEPAEPVALERIGAREVDREVGTRAVDRARAGVADALAMTRL